ncbi:MAG TPA: hypothetical protein VJ767_05890 [Nitrososphaeraceae archaeon]|nr:hypothetical protein [Nitrososphaeraceae archaeon]
MQTRIVVHTVSIYFLVGIAILATFALVAELLPEVKAKMIVIPTLSLIIGWTIFFLIPLARRK